MDTNHAFRIRRTASHFRHGATPPLQCRDASPVSYRLRSPTRASLQGCVSRSTPHHLRSLTRATSIRRSERAFRICRDASHFAESRDRDCYSVSYLLRSLHPRKKTSGRGFIPSVNSRQTSSPPLAPIHPRKLSRLRQSLGLTPFAQLHPRNLDSPQRTRLPRPPHRIAVLVMSRPPSSLLPLAQPYPRKKTSGRGFIPSVNSRQTSSPPLAPIDPRKLSRLRQSLGLTPLAQLHPRNLDSPQRTSLPHPQRRIAVLVMSRPPSSLLPLAQPYPRKELGARLRSAAKSKTPAGGQRYENPPFAQPHPRKLSGLSRSLDFTPFAQLHLRNLGSLQRTRLPRPPQRIAVSRIPRPRPFFGLGPLAQPTRASL